MNIIKSDEWEQLANCIKTDNVDTINYIFNFLIEETERYEKGESYYPRIEFAITIARDMNKNKPKIKEPPKAIEQIFENPYANKQIFNPKTIRETVRNSWLIKFETEKIPENIPEKIPENLPETSKTPPPSPPVSQENLPKPLSVKQTIAKRRKKKIVTDPE
jgi:hypothetical protein